MSWVRKGLGLKKKERHRDTGATLENRLNAELSSIASPQEPSPINYTQEPLWATSSQQAPSLVTSPQELPLVTSSQELSMAPPNEMSPAAPHQKLSSFLSPLELPLANKSQEQESRSPVGIKRTWVTGGNSTTTEGEYGIQVLKDPKDAVIDIIFIHGLNGNRKSAWTKEDKRGECFWPEDLLPDDIPDARIAVWGYDADVVSKKLLEGVSTNGIEQHAETLCSDITNFRVATERPIFFIVHSLGGLVCKAALLHASEARTKERSHTRTFLECTYGIAFLGTPHQGIAQANWGRILASIISLVKQTNSGIVSELSKESSRLGVMQERFYALLNSRKEEGNPIEVTCFYEELEFGRLGVIVPENCARMLGHKAVGIHADHVGIAKFASEESHGYVRICGELKRWVEDLKIPKDDNNKDDAKRVTSRSAPPAFYHYGNFNTSGGAVMSGNQSFSNMGPMMLGAGAVYHA